MMEDIVKRIVLNAKDNASSSLNNVAKAAGNVSNTFSTLKSIAVGAGITFGVGQIVKSAMDMETAMAGIRKVVDVEPGEDANTIFSQMEKDLLAMSRKIPTAATELAKIAAAGGQFGIKHQFLKDFTELTAKMGVAFDITADQAGESIAKLANILGIDLNKKQGMEQMKDMGDTINFLANNMATKAPEIVEVLKRIGSFSSTFGVSREQTAALASTMIALGTAPDLAGTSIKNLMNTLSRVNTLVPKAKVAFLNLGLSQKHIAGLINKGKGQDAIMEVLDHINKVKNATDKMSNVSYLFGRDVAPDIIKLAKSVKVYKQSLDLVKSDKVKGSMEKEFEALANTTEGQLKILKNTVGELATHLGKLILPTINAIATSLASIFGWVSDLITKFPVLGTVLQTVGVSIAGLKIGSFLMSLGSLATSIKDLTFLSGLFNASLLANPITWIVGGIAAFGAAAAGLYDILDKGFENSWVGKLWYSITGKKPKNKEPKQKKWVVDKQVEGMTLLKMVDVNEKKNVASLNNAVVKPAGTATDIMAKGIKNAASFNGKIKIENATNNKISSSFDITGMGLDLILGQREFAI